MEARDKLTNPFTGETRTIPAGVVVRVGNASDQAAIGKLCSEVQYFNNWDYLPGLWDMFMEDRNYLMVVAERDGKVLAVSGMQVLNKGQTWVEFGNRSSPTVRGNNVFWACNAHRISVGLKQYGSPSNISLVSGTVKDAKKYRTKVLNYRGVLFRTYTFLGYAMNAESVQRLSDHVTSSVTSPTEVHAVPSAAEFAELLSDPDKQFALFPEGFFNLMVSLYEAIPQSAYDVWESSPMKFTALSKTPKENHLTISFVSPCLVSSGRGINFQFQLFGYLDHDVFMAHLRHHWPQMLGLFEGLEEMYVSLEVPGYYCLKPFDELFRNKLKLESGGIGIGTTMSLRCDTPKVNI